MKEIFEHLKERFWYNSWLRTKFYNLKRRIQWFKRGWADSDTFSIDYWFTDRIVPMLTYLRDNLHGHPAELTEEEWREILRELIFYAERMDEDYWWDHYVKEMGGYDNVSAEQIRLISKKTDEYKDNFFELFSEWFFHLWD